ncbi:alpha/beta hydrolase [Moritella sp. Urea-trap-13]|uniref:alpha/beta hydrolase n=1 Tax=Moritella sp. Urea-trap-13 TaxID=2058327 RepID=UPI000C34DD64|nr:alpha/beta hydrolase [Moritella sp. Urea-trap-13]PKH07958.1 alpha/beta hydrolase [Moritella sp. Urea-trap-13]
MWFLIVAIVVFAFLLFIRNLYGEDLRQYDSTDLSATFYRPTPSHKYPQALELLASIQQPISFTKPSNYLYALRKKIDRLGDVELDCEIIPVATQFQGKCVMGEWIISKNSDVNKRLLYIHGGGFVVGSAKSHRVVTERLSRELGVAVFAVNYDMIPDGKRAKGIEDCRNAYQWLLEHNPYQQQVCHRIYVAGDSAGGNLSLSLIGWLKHQNIRQVDAAIAICPCIDSTFSYGSLSYNAKTDFLLNPFMGKFQHFPQFILLIWVTILFRMNPSNPKISPIFANLADLPPILIQASDTEMMVDDSRRYTNKARSQGSDVRLQTWSNMLHVWHLFDLEEADEAYAEIGKFVAQSEHQLERVVG